MPLATFEAFCEGLCDMAGVPPPALARDEHGAVAFTLQMRGVDVTALEVGAVRPEVAYLIAEVGPLPQRDPLQRCRVLMDANARMAGQRCAFSVNRETGQLLLHRAVPFASASAVAVYEEVCEMVEATLQWREESIAAPDAWPCIVTRSDSPTARIVEDHGVLPPEHELDALHEALQANFLLMTDEDGAAFARDPASGALVKQCAGPIEHVGQQHAAPPVEGFFLRA